MTTVPSPKIAPSILSADFAILADEVKKLEEAGAEWVHVDVMDGHFVPNLTIGATVVASLRKHTGMFFDCHLMVSDPAKWINDFKKAGASQITFHIEAVADAGEVISKIREAGMRAAVAVKPKTPLDAVLPLLDRLDMVFIMTVEPGFGGQKFMPDMMPKVEQLRKLTSSLDIQVDGGLTPETVHEAARAGANVIVAGTAIFGERGRYKEAIDALRSPIIEHQKQARS